MKHYNALALIFLSSVGGRLAIAADQPQRPNIIVILADDLGRECLSSYGSLSYKTPNLDALAAGGIRFANGYSTPLCSPTRAMLMTGRYGFRTGWTSLIGRGGEDALEFFDPQKEKTFGHVMRSAGYRTGVAGKWQLARFDERPDHMNECGFDEYCMWTWQYGGQRTSRYWSPSVWQDGKVRTDTAEKYGPDVFGNWVDGFLERNKDKPFFLYYPMVLTHGPFDPTPDSIKAEDSAVKSGGKKAGKAAAKGEAGKKLTKKEKRATVEPEDDSGNPQEFAAMVAYMDKTVGRITESVKRLGLEENTLILFTGDNGTPREVFTRLSTPSGERLVRGGKGQMTDTGSHVPFIASWKGKTPPGKVSEQLIDFTDVMPTVAELAGAELPKGVTIDGSSFASTLQGKSGPQRDWVHTQLGDKKWVRDRQWKLVNSGELFDLKIDPWEERPIRKGEGGEAATAARAKLETILAKLK